MEEQLNNTKDSSNLKDPLKKDNSKFDTLTLSGGGTKAILFLGALQYIYDSQSYILNNILNYVCTSSGCIIGYLLCIGYKPVEIIVYLLTNNILEKLSLKYDFTNITTVIKNGVVSFNTLNEILEKMTLDKIGKLLSLKELYIQMGKKLVCITYNLTQNKTEYINYETYPDIQCLTAIRMSCNIPFIFPEFTYMKNSYIDGGITSNIDIEYSKKIGLYNVLILNIIMNKTTDKNLGFLDYLYNIVLIPLNELVNNQIKNCDNKCIHVNIIDNKKFFDFSINKDTVFDMFNIGYNTTKEKFEN